MMEFFWRRLRRGDRGFTLIELLIVVAIIAILAAILIPNFLRSRGQARVAASKGNMKNLGTALESRFVTLGGYPIGDVADFEEALVVERFLNVLPKKPNDADYTYLGTDGTSYYVCDDTTDDEVTDPDGITVWYYNPKGGLQKGLTLDSDCATAASE